MFFKAVIINSFLLLFVILSTGVYSQQKIKDFYLSNVKEDGSKDWEVIGKEAVLYDEYVDIEDMEANYKSEEETIHIKSDKARLNKSNMDVQLEDNVQIENEAGARLSTESLNWKKEENHIETKDWVKTSKDAMEITGEGLSADTELKEVDFLKNVEAILSDKNNKDAVAVTCKGPLEIDYNAGRAVFNEDVVVTNQQGKLFSDIATLFFDAKEKVIIKIVSEGNVKIIRDDNVTFSQKATYMAKEQKITLEGKPRLIYFPKEGQGLDF